MSEEQKEPKPEVEREERRLERVRLITLPPRDDFDDEDPGPVAA
jgi:hypothetical protein